MISVLSFQLVAFGFVLRVGSLDTIGKGAMRLGFTSGMDESHEHSPEARKGSIV